MRPHSSSCLGLHPEPQPLCFPWDSGPRPCGPRRNSAVVSPNGSLLGEHCLALEPEIGMRDPRWSAQSTHILLRGWGHHATHIGIWAWDLWRLDLVRELSLIQP